MIPNLYKIAGEQLPGVFNVSARAVASHTLSIFSVIIQMFTPVVRLDAAMLCESSVQEVMDLTPVAHCAALKGKIPFHQLLRWFPYITRNPEDRDMGLRRSGRSGRYGCNQGIPCTCTEPEPPMSERFSSEPGYHSSRLEKHVTHTTMLCRQSFRNTWTKLTLRSEQTTNCSTTMVQKTLRSVIIAMGSVCDTIEETIDYLIAAGREGWCC